jgi:hypothetical protein
VQAVSNSVVSIVNNVQLMAVSDTTRRGVI